MFTPVALPTELASVVAQVRAWSGPDRPRGVSADDRAAWVAGLRQLADATEAAFLGALGDFDAYGDGFVLHGAQSTASWLRGALHLAPGDAATKVRAARAASGVLAKPVAALVDGEVTWDQVVAIERTAHRLDEPSAAGEAVDLLTDLARCSDVTAVRVAGQRIRMTVDPDGSLRDAERDFTRRYLQLSPLLDGMVALDGLLDPESAATVGQAMAPFLVPAGPEDGRTAAQRRADALVDLAIAAIAADAVPELSGAPANLAVVVPVDTLVGSARDPVLLPDHPGGLALLPPAAARRLSCGALLTGAWISGTTPLRLGRTQRLFTAAQRRAVALRDGGCRFPGCPRPARYTDAHHLVPWVDGGATDLTNALLTCRWHHRRLHEGGWRAVVADAAAGTNGRLWFHPPDGRPPLPSDPRGP